MVRSRLLSSLCSDDSLFNVPIEIRCTASYWLDPHIRCLKFQMELMFCPTLLLDKPSASPPNLKGCIYLKAGPYVKRNKTLSLIKIMSSSGSWAGWAVRPNETRYRIYSPISYVWVSLVLYPSLTLLQYGLGFCSAQTILGAETLS